MAWYVRFEHMFGSKMNIGVHAVDIDGDGKIVTDLPQQAVEHCQAMPSVFEHRPSEDDDHEEEDDPEEEDEAPPVMPAAPLPPPPTQKGALPPKKK